LGARWGVIIGRHQAASDRLKRSIPKDRSHVLHKDHQAWPAPWDPWLAELLLGSIHHNTFADAFR